ncbi:MAG TPA: hypothetical protein VI172_09735 [Candidatus Dormibacteraeota bacterium]|jgi:hypothetical protein
MTALATNVIPNVGADIAPMLVAPTNGDTAVCGSGTFLYVKNTNAAACVVTIACPVVQDGRLTTSSSTFSVPLTTGVGVIPLLPLYADPATGRATITSYSVTSGVTVAVVRVP